MQLTFPIEQRVCGIFVETMPNNALVEIALRVFTLIEFLVRRQLFKD